MSDPDRLAASYLRFSDQPVANPQVFVDEGCILDLDAEGRLVGVEIIGPRVLTDVLPAIFARARFRQATTEADLADERGREVARLRDLLRGIEWAAGDDFGAACPECQGYRDSADGHLPDCELAAALAGNDETTRPSPREG